MWFLYSAFPLIFALLPPGTQAFASHKVCHDERDNVIKCPISVRIIVAIAVPLGCLALLSLGLAVYWFLRWRRARAQRAFTNLENMPAPFVPAYGVGAPRMERGNASQWAPPSQYKPNTTESDRSLPPLPPSAMAHGESYTIEDPEKHEF